jgi:dipeptidase E
MGASMQKRRIVALGGGGFSMEAENPLLDDYVLGLTGKRRPRVCFLPTASADSDSYTERFYKAFKKPRSIPSHLGLFKRDRTDLRRFLLGQDVIYVGGGNTANMLAIWRVHGIDKILMEAWKAGIVLCGISAGMNCWFESSCTDSFGGLAALRDGLGFIRGSACPHYDGEINRRPIYRKLIRKGILPSGFAADDGAALHFAGSELKEVVTSRRSARAYHLMFKNGQVTERELPYRYLLK